MDDTNSNSYINTINNYLIDEEIKINENDKFINKLKYVLLKYKRIIAIILLIILLFIGYQCNLHFLNINQNANANANANMYQLKGGARFGQISSSIGKGLSSAGSTLWSGKTEAIKSGAKGAYNFGAQRAADYKEFAPWFYGMIYSIAISVLMFLIFMPAVGFFVVGMICYSILKDKMVSIKSL